MRANGSSFRPMRRLQQLLFLTLIVVMGFSTRLLLLHERPAAARQHVAQLRLSARSIEQTIGRLERAVDATARSVARRRAARPAGAASAVRVHVRLGAAGSADESSDCSPRAAAAASRALDYVVAADAAFPANCEGRTDVSGVEELCAAVRRVALRREVLVAVCDSNVQPQLQVFVEATRKAAVSNLLVIALDQRLADWCDGHGVARWLRQDSARGSHKISAQKFKFIGTILSVGASVLVSDIDVVYIQDPFRFLYRDSDVEGTTDGWDAATAYGWTEQVDDEALGWGRYSYSHRSTAWNSGLWFVQATRAGVRLMTLLAHRMATETTWDQTAYNEEVGLPARVGHSGAGITRRAANYLCFINSKTLYRKVLRDEGLRRAHRPVVLHVNYHQPKPPKMRAAFQLYHAADDSLVEKELAHEPTALMNTTQLEEDVWLQLNGGFIMGRSFDLSSREAVEGRCLPSPPQLGFSYELHCIQPAGQPLPSCDGAGLIACATLSSLRFTDGAVQAILVVFDSQQLPALVSFLHAASALTLDAPLLLAPADAAAAAKLSKLQSAGKVVLPAEEGRPAGAVLPPPADRDVGYTFELTAALLQAGVATLLLSPRVALLRDSPFRYLHRDADIEISSDGWDDRSAYGYNHVLDDPSMGFTRNCHGLRIAAHDVGIAFAMPTIEARRLMQQLSQRLRGDKQLSAARAVSEELFFPAHNGVTRSGARTRVMNLLCFGNSKTFFSSHVHEMFPSLVPVAVHVSYHEDVTKRIDALVARYQRGDSSALKPMLIERLSKEQRELCQLPRLFDEAAASGSEWARHVQESGTWEWSGTGPMLFEQGGRLSTPWGSGTWGVLRGNYLFADFVGSRHNLKFDSARKGQFVSSRCGDGDPVLQMRQALRSCSAHRTSSVELASKDRQLAQQAGRSATAN
ncbi:hypothetical protein AB1Y20_022813 [Prymnesium parvum]|uniref:Nucleotide-diphospho-sugar transferase domain-containing protein n=1 Tax=Prymnesium parvum TaxID=97485 RepID=A0AB34JBY7_PRYPA